MQLALGIMTALYARERTGRGQEVNTSSLGALMWIQAWEITHTTMSDETLRREGQHNPNIRCPYGIYETKDGGAFLLAVAMSDESWDEFWLFVDRPEVVLDTRWNNGAKRIGARGVTDGVDEIRRARARGVRDARRPPSGPSSSPRSPRSSTSGSRTTTSWSPIRRSPPTATSSTSTCRSSGRPASSATSCTSATRPAAGVRRPPPLLGEHTAEVMEELGFGRRRDRRASLASAAGFADQIIAAIFDD